MRRIGAVVVLSCAAVVFTGCGDLGARPYGDGDLGPARDVVLAAVDALGGRQAWDEVAYIEAWALVSAYDESAAAHISRQRLVIDLRADRITAYANAPSGYWKATVDRDGKCSFKARGFQSDELYELRTGRQLELILAHVPGPLNLLRPDQHALNVREANLDGVDLTRVGVLDDDGVPWAYYFDRTGNVLRFVTCGGDRPGEPGTFASYKYMMTPQGLAFPEQIRIVRIGEHTVSGGAPVLEVQFEQVKFHSSKLIPPTSWPGWTQGL